MDIVPILPDYSDKVGNLKVTLTDIRDAECADYAHYMQKMLQFSEAQREENRKIAEIRKKRYGIDPHAQQPSTQAILARPKEKDEEHFFRPLPKEIIEANKILTAAITSNDETKVKELIAQREVTEQEEIVYKQMQREPKNEIGQSEKTAFGEKEKKAAEEAFLFSPGILFDQLTEDEKRRITTPYAERGRNMESTSRGERSKPVLKQSRPLGSRIKHWLWKKGFPIHRFTKKKFTVEEADK